MRASAKTCPGVCGRPETTNPTGRLDVLAFRLADQYLLPAIEAHTGMAGLATQLRPYAETIIAEAIPPVDFLKPLRTPRRRLCS